MSGHLVLFLSLLLIYRMSRREKNSMHVLVSEGKDIPAIMAYNPIIKNMKARHLERQAV